MRQAKLLLLVGSTALLMIGFQNCSKYQYASTDTSGNNSGLNTDNLPDNSSNQVNQIPDEGNGSNPPANNGGGNPENPVVNPPVAGNPPPAAQPPASSPPASSPPAAGNPPSAGNPPTAGQPPSSSLPPVIMPPPNDDKDCKEYATQSKDESSAGISCHKSDPKAPPVKKCYVNINDDDDDKDLADSCNNLKSSHNNKDRVGNNIISARGKLVITKNNVDQINLIQDFRGKLILCGVKVKKISGCKGKILAVDSQIDEIADHKGKLEFIGSSSCPNIHHSSSEVDINRGG